jgi:hypothetical protein
MLNTAHRQRLAFPGAGLVWPIIPSSTELGNSTRGTIGRVPLCEVCSAPGPGYRRYPPCGCKHSITLASCSTPVRYKSLLDSLHRGCGGGLSKAHVLDRRTDCALAHLAVNDVLMCG